jgi:hypothetical protein
VLHSVIHRYPARFRYWLVVPVCAVTLILALLSRASAHSEPQTSQLLYTQPPCTAVYSSPATSATMLAQLLGGTDVRPLGSSGSGPTAWEHVTIWSGVDGYIQAGALAATAPGRPVQGDCPFPGVPDPEPDILPHSYGPWPLSATGTVRSPATIFADPSFDALPVSGARPGTPVTISKWASDTTGSPWYAITYRGGHGWIWSGSVRLSSPEPATRTVNGVPIWAHIAGKGMWFTNYFTRDAGMAAVMDAAKKAGITHLYAEVAITRYGFYGRNSLDRLLPVAHAAGIAVIAWVYPTLRDVSADARMTEQVAHYVTPSGDRPDGIATDVEEINDSASVYTYGQLVRGLLGADELLVAAVYHPYAESYYPYAAIAASWNVLAPMDYWHSLSRHTYTANEVRRFVSSSVITIQAASAEQPGSASLPVEELGQMYDMYTSDGIGGHASPTASEITADIAAARDTGCIGVSFFEWQTATQDEWQALASYHW